MKKGKIIGLVVVLIFVGALGIGLSQMSKNPDKYQGGPSDVNTILDATQFYVDKNTTMSEKQIIEKLGEPDSVEKWNYKQSGKTYPIKTLRYGNYEYLLNSDMLQRINLNEEIKYKNKNDILKMFGLQKYKNSVIKDTNSSYRVSNCGVNDFWIQYDDSAKTMNFIKISYGTLFTE